MVIAFKGFFCLKKCPIICLLYSSFMSHQSKGFLMSDKLICPHCQKTIEMEDKFCAYCGWKNTGYNNSIGPCDYDIELDKTIRSFYPDAIGWYISKNVRFEMKRGYAFVVSVKVPGLNRARFLNLRCCYSLNRGYFFISSLPPININKKSPETMMALYASRAEKSEFLTNEDYCERIRKIVDYEIVDDISTWKFFGVEFAKIESKSYEVTKKIQDLLSADVAFDKRFRDIFDISSECPVNTLCDNICGFLPEICKKIFEESNGILKGDDGEKAVVDYLDLVKRGDCVILPNVRLSAGNTDFENDAIIINNCGIYTIEIKNYSKGVLHISNDGCVKHNDIAEKENVIMQSERHKGQLIKFLTEKSGNSEIKDIVKSAIVVANNSIEIINETNYPIMRTGLISTYVFDGETVLSKNDIDRYTDMIMQDKKENYKHEMKIYDELEVLNKFSSIT